MRLYLISGKMLNNGKALINQSMYISWELVLVIREWFDSGEVMFLLDPSLATLSKQTI